MITTRQPRARRHLLPRRMTLRSRLTLIFSGLFLAAGVLLLGTTYALFDRQLTGPTGMGAVPVPTGGSEEQQDVSVRPGDDATGGTVPVQIDRQDIRETATRALLAQGGIALVVVGGIAAGFGWLIAGRVLAPLHQVTETAARIAAAPAADRSLHERIALEGPDDEVRALADTFDTMVERLDQSFDGQRRFVANASHELRTPLTLSRALIELAMHRKDASDDVMRLGTDLLQINARHERLISGLLLLAASNDQVPELRPVDLADVAVQVVAQTEAEARDGGVTVHVAAHEAVTRGDGLLLERLAVNLVENAIRHNIRDDGWVRVATGVRDGHAYLRVTNTGPEVPRYDVPLLFEPFRRLGNDGLVTTKGAGLGLSIVHSIARAHGGTVHADPRATGGLTVTVTLPSAS